MASAGQDLGSDAFVTIAESCRSSGTTPWTSRSASNAITDGYDLEYAEAEEPPLQSTSLHILGEGAYGTVTEVTSKETKQVMALKTIRLDQLKDSPAIARKEISSLRLLDHYHIVQIVGNYLKKRQPEDVIGLLLQPVADTDLMLYLTSLTQNSNRVYPDCGRPEEFLPKAFGCLANALRYIHKHKVEHLDLKPENILLKGSNVLITDFGVARIFNTRSDTSAPVTTTKKVRSIRKQSPSMCLTKATSTNRPSSPLWRSTTDRQMYSVSDAFLRRYLRSTKDGSTMRSTSYLQSRIICIWTRSLVSSSKP